MSLGRYAIGWVVLAVCIGLAAHAGRRLAGMLLTGSSQPIRWVGSAILGLSLLLVALEAAGILGVLSALGTVVAVAVLWGVVVWRVPARRQGEAGRPSVPAAEPAVARVAAVVLAAIVAAPWLGWTVFAYRHGMETIDTLWYHMPFAARFVQTGSILGLHYVDANPVVAFYPANSELFHAFALAAFRSDWLSPLITLGWAGLAVLAGWALGRPFGRQLLSVVSVLAVLGTTDLITSQPGGAYNDVVCLALLLSSAAVLVHGGWQLGPSFVAALAAGLAAGTKVTMIVPAAVLALGASVASPPRLRRRQLGIWILGTLATGGYWFVRNLAQNGNPLGAVRLGVGPVALPAPRTAPLSSIAGSITDWHIWSSDFLPGLRSAFGPAWWLLFVLIIAGILAALTPSSRPVMRMLAFTSLVSLIALALAPQTGEPGSFRYNLRYETPAMALGLVLLTLHGRLDPRRRRLGVLWLLGTLVVITEVDGAIWPTHLGSQPLATPLTGGPALAGSALAAAAALIWLVFNTRGLRQVRARMRHARGRTAGVCLIAAAVVLPGGLVVARSYASHRYQGLAPLPRTFAWAQRIHHTRIGIVGVFDQYPFYGIDSSNYVQYIGEPQPHAGFGRATTCQRWRQLINGGDYDWLVVAPPGFPLTLLSAPEVGWTTGPGVSAQFTERVRGGPATDAVAVFRVRGRLEPRGCS